MTTDNVVTVLFCLVMIANLIAFVRHWIMMRALRIVLISLVETHNYMIEVSERREQREQHPLAPLE